MNKYLLPLAVAAMLAGSSMAFAATATGNFTAKITINAFCKITTGPTDLDFGTDSVALESGATATPATFKFRCTKGTNFTLGLRANPGTRAGTATVNRNLGHATLSDTIAYSASVTPSATTAASGNDDSFSITGTIAAIPTSTIAPSPGNYADNLTLVVNY